MHESNPQSMTITPLPRPKLRNTSYSTIDRLSIQDSNAEEATNHARMQPPVTVPLMPRLACSCSEQEEVMVAELIDVLSCAGENFSLICLELIKLVRGINHSRN